MSGASQADQLEKQIAKFFTAYLRELLTDDELCPNVVERILLEDPSVYECCVRNMDYRLVTLLINHFERDIVPANFRPDATAFVADFNDKELLARRQCEMEGRYRRLYECLRFGRPVPKIVQPQNDAIESDKS
ncbi:MAG: hypothetical protein SFX18_14730 [Pirellulales bacterium]|nr:hypothetical protein [Pirellulales bacterium]